MGDIADSIINGDVDSVTGEYLGEGDGFPRTTTGQLHETQKPKKKKPKSNTKLTRELRARVDGKEWYHAKFAGVPTDQLIERICKAYMDLLNKDYLAK